MPHQTTWDKFWWIASGVALVILLLWVIPPALNIKYQPVPAIVTFLWELSKYIRNNQIFSTSILLFCGIIVIRLIAWHRWDGFWWVTGILIILAVCIFISWQFREDLHSEIESPSSTIRNIGLVIGGIAAALLTIWRSIVSERQAHTAQQTLLNERYQQGAEMLGSGVFSVRLGGIYALQRLADEHPEEYHLQIMNLLCAFVRAPTKDEDATTKDEPQPATSRVREDVQAAMTAIGRRSKVGIDFEKGAENFQLNLGGAVLTQADLRDTNLTGTNLTGANLSDANLCGADLTGANFTIGDLSDANLSGANFSRTEIGYVNFSGATLANLNLTGAVIGVEVTAKGLGSPKPVVFIPENLTQDQLNQACADPKDKPKIERSIIAADTKEPLNWCGGPCK